MSAMALTNVILSSPKVLSNETPYNSSVRATASRVIQIT